MSVSKYSEELKVQVLKSLEEVGDAKAVAERHNNPVWVVRRFRREKLKSPEINKDKKIKQLTQQLKDKELENLILRELLKKTYQAMPSGEK
jgi:hypothetical protein